MKAFVAETSLYTASELFITSIDSSCKRPVTTLCQGHFDPGVIPILAFSDLYFIFLTFIIKSGLSVVY